MTWPSQEEMDRQRGPYIGRKRVVERIERDYLIAVWADNAEQAREMIEAGKGDRYAYLGEKREVLEEDPVRDVHYDVNEGMGR